MASFGENLRRERELRGIELAEIAAATKIGTRFLQAIEEERWEILPGGMFPRAFVRQYAAFLGLDVERTVTEFVRAHDSAWKATPGPAPKARSRDGWGPAVFLIIAGLLGLGLMLMGKAPSRTRASHLPPIVAETGTASTVTLPAAAPLPDFVLEFKARQQCWVEVRADGQSVMNRVLGAGEATTVRASDEVLLSVGNAGGLELNINGQPGLPLGREGEVRRNIRITRDSLDAFVKTLVTVASSRSN